MHIFDRQLPIMLYTSNKGSFISSWRVKITMIYELFSGQLANKRHRRLAKPNSIEGPFFYEFTQWPARRVFANLNGAIVALFNLGTRVRAPIYRG